MEIIKVKLTQTAGKVDNAIHRINHYPLDEAIGFVTLVRQIVINPLQ